MKLRRGAAAIALVLAIQSSGGRASAAAPQVALDVTPADSAIIPPLRAELRELGIDVVDAPSGNGASVTLHVAITSESLEVRIVDQPTGRTTVQETFPSMGGTAMDPRTAVLHAVELLRWHLRFTPTNDAATAAPVPVATAAPAERSPVGRTPTSNTGIGLAPCALYSPGGTGLGLGGQIDVLRRWGRWGARVLGGSVLAPNRISVPEGSIEVTGSWGGLAGVLIVGGDGRTSLELGVGATVFASTLHGKANGDNVGQDDRLIAFAPFGEVRLRERITPGFALSLGSTLFVPLESSRLRVLDREVGRYGQAVVTFGLGVETTLF